MVKKSISIESYQEEALKKIISETAIKSESEIIRAALDEKYPELMKEMRRKHTEVRG